MTVLAAALIGAAAAGLIVLVAQRVVMGWVLRTPPRAPRSMVPVSILKPLCGVDDELEQNLATFAALDHPRYEVLLGVRDTADAAYPVALAAQARWPDRFRVVLQHGEPGLNPKVNQLATLERAARFELLLVSDSNTRVHPGMLAELVSLFEDPRVACASWPVSGTGHRTFGALLDNLHLASAVGPAQVAVKAFPGKDLVVGKAMAVRRAALERLGGFATYANVLAEDYVIGREVVKKLGLKVAIARLPVHNVAVRRTVKGFFRRYLRWGVIHRTAVSFPTSLTQGLANPWPLTLLAAAAYPSRHTVAIAAITFVVKASLDLSGARRLGCGPLGLKGWAAVAVKDVLLFITWVNGFLSRTVEWRGNRLTVQPGSRLVAPGDGVEPQES